MAKKDLDSLDEKKTEKSSSDGKKNKKASSKSDAKKTKTGFFTRIKKWFHDLRSEFKKVIWPSKKTVRNHTTVVLVTIIVFSVFLGLLDTGLLKLMELLISFGE